ASNTLATVSLIALKISEARLANQFHLFRTHSADERTMFTRRSITFVLNQLRRFLIVLTIVRKAFLIAFQYDFNVFVAERTLLTIQSQMRPKQFAMFVHTVVKKFFTVFHAVMMIRLAIPR